MKIEFLRSFERDLRKTRDRSLLLRVQTVIEHIEQADSIQQIYPLKKLAGDDEFYRIRIGDYRLGLIIEADTVTFVRFLHRKDLHRYFP